MKLEDGLLRVQRFVPDLAIEVASQGERFEALLKKALCYRGCGTKEVYLFSIATRQVFAYSERGTVVLSESEEFRSELIPGFPIKIGDLFRMI